MVAVPAPAPVTTPEELIVATEEGAQLHVPPVNELLSVLVLPMQMGALPVIVPGKGLTVTTAVTVPHAAT